MLALCLVALWWAGFALGFAEGSWQPSLALFAGALVAPFTAFGVAQRNPAAAGCEFLGEIFGHVERDRHLPQGSVGQPHILTNAFVVGAV